MIFWISNQQQQVLSLRLLFIDSCRLLTNERQYTFNRFGRFWILILCVINTLSASTNYRNSMFNRQIIKTITSQATFLTTFRIDQRPVSKCIENSSMALFLLPFSFSIYDDVAMLILCVNIATTQCSFCRFFNKTSM